MQCTVAASTFANRKRAGMQLAAALHAYAGRDDIVVEALPRGGVPIAYEVALALHAPLDVVVAHKIGAPGQRELAMGAVTAGGSHVIYRRVVDALQLDDAAFAQALQRARDEAAANEATYRAFLTELPVGGRTAIVVDDGIATGSTLHAAIRSLRARGALTIVVAVPVAPADAAQRFAHDADAFVCIRAPESFTSVGAHYDDFTQVTDGEVRELLERAAALTR